MQKMDVAAPASLRPVWWKVIAGGVLIPAGVGNMFALFAPASGQLLGAAVFVLGVWLAYSGTKPLRQDNPKDRLPARSEPLRHSGPVFFGNPVTVRKRDRASRANLLK